MITIIAGGIAFIVLVALIVPVIDALQAPTWRRIAKERRRLWEERQLELHGSARPRSWRDR